ncbi:MAG: CDP-alcohol phosphatidyltransferase family protein [Planctomycetota bacterium]|nr:CDP-alcohol phosphatidyltransferase family protein [Planctomycetota bacterium]MDA1177904.1 CDP-alcohol phosphatidyltransferase family protein [Planctomycetota bacterium]
MTEEPYSGERRPIAARRWKLIQWIAESLIYCGASPNGISIAGALFGIIGGCAFAATTYWSGWEQSLWLVAAGMIQLRLQCNLYDGMVAIATNRASPLGEIYNDVPDRVSDSALFIGLGYAVGGNAILGYAAALAAMFTAYVRAIGKSGGAKQEFCGPMAKQHRMAILTAMAAYCAFAPTAWQPTWGTPSAIGIPAVTLAVITIGSFITAARRLLRIARQLREANL